MAASATVEVRIGDMPEVKELLDHAAGLVEFVEWCTDFYDDEGVPPVYEEITVRAEIALGRRDPDDPYGLKRG